MVRPWPPKSLCYASLKKYRTGVVRPQTRKAVVPTTLPDACGRIYPRGHPSDPLAPSPLASSRSLQPCVTEPAPPPPTSPQPRPLLGPSRSFQPPSTSECPPLRRRTAGREPDRAGMGFIGAHGVETLKRYKYSGEDRSVVAKYVLQPFWSRCVTLFPLWMP